MGGMNSSGGENGMGDMGGTNMINSTSSLGGIVTKSHEFESHEGRTLTLKMLP